MGCDIHSYSETWKDNQWVCDTADTLDEYQEEGEEHLVIELDDSPYISRDYHLFGLLCAGVRCEFDYSFPERGLPDDVSSQIQKVSDDWDCDGHSHSYVTLAELRDKAMHLLVVGDGVNNGNLQSLQFLINHFPKDADGEYHRLVFWFDN